MIEFLSNMLLFVWIFKWHILFVTVVLGVPLYVETHWPTEPIDPDQIK